MLNVFIGITEPVTLLYFFFRANQESPAHQGTEVTQEHQVYLESMVYLGLLGRKVERSVHILRSTVYYRNTTQASISLCFSFPLRGTQVYLGHLGRMDLQA